MLMVIRGNSGAGKSSVARGVRERYGRGLAIVDQDHFRRRVLWEKDVADGLAPAFIAHTVSYLLEAGWPVILEGILHSARYGAVLTELIEAHRGPAHLYYLDTTLEETFARHATRPQAAEFTTGEMRSWYAPGDVLGLPGEIVIPESSTLEETVDRICRDAGFSVATQVL
jgi:AAA domain-containing protein